jgi:hypothetical protein
MFKHPQICIAHSLSPWDMMIGIVGRMISCMKGQETYTRFKVKYNKKETLRSTTPLGEETSILAMDSKEEEEEEEWVEVEKKSFVITAHNQDTWKGTVKNLALLLATATRSNTLSRNVQHCWINFKRNDDLSITRRYS